MTMEGLIKRLERESVPFIFFKLGKIAGLWGDRGDNTPKM